LTQTTRSTTKKSSATHASPVHQVIADAAQDFIWRLLNHYLPDPDRGYAGDDHPVQAAPPAPTVDPHQVLGLPVGTSTKDIKRRVRQLARVFHPDVPGGNANKMAEINDAADRLLRPREPSEAG
jgi:hypothetical protein